MTACHYGERACPSTKLYQEYLMHHEATLAKNPRMALRVRLHETLLAQLAPHSQPTALSRLLGLGPLQVRPWSMPCALLR